jgi:hypothetical protein
VGAGNQRRQHGGAWPPKVVECGRRPGTEEGGARPL